MLRSNRAVCEAIESRRLLNGGIRDMGFGGDGVVTAAELSNSDLTGIALQPDGKVLVGGNPYIVRLLPNAQPDSNFGWYGQVRTWDTLLAVAPNGSFYVVTKNMGSLYLSRYTANGVGDPSFGVFLQPITPRSNYAELTRTLADGSLLVGGHEGGLWKISASGTLSNLSGEVTGTVCDVIELSDGDLFVGYKHKISLPSGLAMIRPALVRLNSDGTRDPSFTPFVDLEDGASGPNDISIARQSNGRVVLACSRESSTALYAFDSLGNRDTTWGINGLITYQFGAFGDVVRDLLVHADDSLTLANSVAFYGTGGVGSRDVMLIHLTSEGERDALFGANGTTRYNGGNADNVVRLLQQADGKLLLLSQPTIELARPVGGEITRYSPPVDSSPISITAYGQLQVTGSDGDDVLTISEVGAQYVVSLNGVEARVSRTLVSSVILMTNGGDDQITLNIQSDVPITVNGGSGDDALHVLHAASAGVHVVNPQAGEASLTFADGTRPISGISVEHIDRGGATPFLVSAALEMETRLALNLAFDADIGTTLSASDLVLRDVATGSTNAIGDADLTLSLTPSGTTLASIALPTNLPSAHWRLDIAAGAFGIGGVNDFEHRVRFDYSPGDVNGNGLTDFADVFAIIQHFGQSVSRRSEGDVNYDGRVGFEDLLAVAQNFNLPAPLPMSVGSRSPKRNELADVVG